VLVTTCDSFENSTWGATAAERAPDQALRHDYVATLASTSPLRSASSAYRYFASGDESLTRAKRHELVVVIRDFGQRATAPERFKYVVVPLAEESGTSRDGTSGLASVTPFTSMCYFRPSWFWIVRTMTNVGIARSAVRRIVKKSSIE